MIELFQNLVPAIDAGLTTTARTRPAAPSRSITKEIRNRVAGFSRSVESAVDSVVGLFSPQSALTRVQCRQAIRSYDAAATDRTTTDIDYRRTDSDSELRSRRIRIMSLSREEQRNDPFFANGLRTSRNNVIGDDESEEGVAVRAAIKLASGEADEKNNKIVDDCWDEYKDKIDLNGRWHFNEILSVNHNGFMTSGESLGVIHDIPATGSDIPFSIELLETDHLPTSNEMWSSGAYAPFAPIKTGSGMATGGYILDGIEYDSNRRIVAYHILPIHPGNEFMFQPIQTRRVPIARVIHYFEPLRPEQARGVPFAASGLSSIYNSNELIKAELDAQRAQTNFPIHFKQVPSTLPFNPSGAAVYDSSGNPVNQVQRSSYTYGPDEPIMLKSDRASTQLVALLKHTGMQAGAAMNMSPSSYMKDSAGLNFSSLREDKMEDRRGYRFLQGLHARYFIKKMWPMFIRALVISGKLIVKSIEDFTRFTKCEVSMPDWGYVNPEQEIKADAYAVAMGQKLPSQIVGKKGRFEHFVKQYAKEVDLCESEGLDFAFMQGELPGNKKSSGTDDVDNDANPIGKSKLKAKSEKRELLNVG